MRTVLYVTGTRADFGLMLSTLRTIAAHPGLSLQICVTGMHLSSRFGMTVDEVVASGLPIAAQIRLDIDNDSGLGMALATGDALNGIARLLAKTRPDVVLVLGDRTEMLAAATAAVCLGIPVAHIHGGERSGTIDESVRHAISKLAHLHLVTTEASRARLIAMGERAESVLVVGAPGLVGLKALASRDREALATEQGLDASRPIALVLFHPVVQEAIDAGEQMKGLLAAVHRAGYQTLCLLPNADAGNTAIRDEILRCIAEYPRFRAVAHLQRTDFVSWMASCDLFVGNSSAGILEAASFGTPVVNVGDRQHARERNSNVVDVPADEQQIDGAIRAASQLRPDETNIYFQEGTDLLIAARLAELSIDRALLKKSNTY
ncbi:MAG: UDP-N-acetylglucosamine 2-epimerase [Caldimonas sp.]